MLTHQSIIEKYHSYFFSCLLDGGEPVSYEEWYEDYMLPYLTGIEILIRNTN